MLNRNDLQQVIRLINLEKLSKNIQRIIGDLNLVQRPHESLRNELKEMGFIEIYDPTQSTKKNERRGTLVRRASLINPLKQNMRKKLSTTRVSMLSVNK